MRFWISLNWNFFIKFLSTLLFERVNDFLVWYRVSSSVYSSSINIVFRILYWVILRIIDIEICSRESSHEYPVNSTFNIKNHRFLIVKACSHCIIISYLSFIVQTKRSYWSPNKLRTWHIASMFFEPVIHCSWVIHSISCHSNWSYKISNLTNSILRSTK